MTSSGAGGAVVPLNEGLCSEVKADRLMSPLRAPLGNLIPVLVATPGSPPEKGCPGLMSSSDDVGLVYCPRESEKCGDREELTALPSGGFEEWETLEPSIFPISILRAFI